MVHANVETRSLECNSGILKDVTRDFTSTEMNLAEELEKGKHDRKKPSETLTRLEEFGDAGDLLTFRRPNPYYTYVRCDVCELSFVCCFSDSHNKNLSFQKLLFVLCASLSTSLISPQPHGPNRG